MSSLRKSHDAVRHGPSNKPPLPSTTTTMMSGGRGTRKSPIPSQLDESHASGGPRHHNNKLGNSLSCGVLDDVKEPPKSLDDMDLLSWNDREADSEVESITKNDRREQVKLNAAAQHDLQMIAKQQQLEVGFPHDQEDDDEEIEEGFEGDEGDKGVEVVASLETGSDFSGSEVTAHAAYMATTSSQQQQQQPKSIQPSLMNIVDPNMIHALSDEQFQYLQNLLATEERRRRAHAPPSFSTSPPSLGLPKNFHNHSSNKVPTKPSISSLSQSLSGSSQTQTGGPGSSSRRFTASSSSSFSSSTKPITPTNNSNGSNSNKSTTVGGVAKKRGSRPGSGSEAKRPGEDEDSLFFPLDEDDESQQQHSSSTALGGAVTSLISDFNNFGVSSSIDDTYVLRYGAAPPTEKMWANGSLSGTSPNKPLPTFGHRRPPKNSGVQISKAAAKSSLRKSVTRGEGEEQHAHLVFSSPSQLKTSDRTAFDDISVSSSNSSASRTRKV